MAISGKKLWHYGKKPPKKTGYHHYNYGFISPTIGTLHPQPWCPAWPMHSVMHSPFDGIATQRLRRPVPKKKQRSVAGFKRQGHLGKIWTQ